MVTDMVTDIVMDMVMINTTMVINHMVVVNRQILPYLQLMHRIRKWSSLENDYDQKYFLKLIVWMYFDILNVFFCEHFVFIFKVVCYF